MGLTTFILVGPTASGKSEVSMRIAAEGGWAVVSADSMMVYRGMDIGTAKPSAEDRARVPHDCIDLVDPGGRFSAGQYRRCAIESIAARTQAGLRTMVVGGSGLYVKALVCGLAAPASDDAAREALRGRLEAGGLEPLVEELRVLDPAAHAALKDPRNPRRVLRALEVAMAGKASGGPDERPWKGGPAVGLWVEPAELRNRIARRAEAMFDGGLVEEVRRLRDGGDFSDTACEAIGYAEADALAAGRCTKAEAVERTVLRTCRLAKRQRTWLRHQLPVEWVDATVPDMERVVAAVKAAWREHGPTAIGDGA